MKSSNKYILNFCLRCIYKKKGSRMCYKSKDNMGNTVIYVSKVIINEFQIKKCIDDNYFEENIYKKTI